MDYSNPSQLNFKDVGHCVCDQRRWHTDRRRRHVVSASAPTWLELVRRVILTFSYNLLQNVEIIFLGGATQTTQLVLRYELEKLVETQRWRERQKKSVRQQFFCDFFFSQACKRLGSLLQRSWIFSSPGWRLKSLAGWGLRRGCSIHDAVCNNRQKDTEIE